jgi:CRISPR-associated endonuclease/helicase Cas3
LINCLTPEGVNGFSTRIKKDDNRIHLAECKQNADADILEQAKNLAGKPLVSAMLKQLNLLTQKEQHGQTLSEAI